MSHQKIRVFTLIFVASIAINGRAFGGEIFHWVDDDGISNFSERAPENSSAEVLKLIVTDANPPDYDPVEDQNSILEQAERINMRWNKLMARQAERRRQRHEIAGQYTREPSSAYDYGYDNQSHFLYRSVHPHQFHRRRASHAQNRQLAALDNLGLNSARRPHSINSSAHLARINAGKTINRGVRMQHSGKARSPRTYRHWQIR